MGAGWEGHVRAEITSCRAVACPERCAEPAIRGPAFDPHVSPAITLVYPEDTRKGCDIPKATASQPGTAEIRA